MKGASKIRAFLIGMILGFLAYVIYLNFLTDDETTATAVGWIFFAPQYFVYWAVPKFDLSETVGLLSCYAFITLLYGYIALSIRLSPKTAVWTFFTTTLFYLMIIHWFDYLMNFKWLAILIQILFWPVYLLSFPLTDTGSYNRLTCILIECLSVAFWYTALLCGVRTIFMFFEKSDGNIKSRDPQPDDNQMIVYCAKCNQQLRVPAASSDVQVRCPSCQFENYVELAKPPPPQENAPTLAANPSDAEIKAAHDKGVGFAVIVGIIAFVVLIFLCRFRVDDGFFSAPETRTNWPGVFIGTGICAFIAYHIGKKICNHKPPN